MRSASISLTASQSGRRSTFPVPVGEQKLPSRQGEVQGAVSDDVKVGIHAKVTSRQEIDDVGSSSDSEEQTAYSSQRAVADRMKRYRRSVSVRTAASARCN